MDPRVLQQRSALGEALLADPTKNTNLEVEQGNLPFIFSISFVLAHMNIQITFCTEHLGAALFGAIQDHGHF